MNKNRIRGITIETRGPTYPKSNTCPESRAVYAAVINVEVTASYPGRSENPLVKELGEPQGEPKGTQKSAAGIVGATPCSEGPKRQERDIADMSMDDGDAEVRAGMPSVTHRRDARNASDHEKTASNATVVKEHNAPTGLST